MINGQPKNELRPKCFVNAYLIRHLSSFKHMSFKRVTRVRHLEGINQLTTGTLISLSEQELVDCDTSGDEGCNGGLMDNVFEFIIGNQTTGYKDVPSNSESTLKAAVANQHVSVAIDASGSDFQFYSSGVYTGECGTDLDHGVTAVGYGASSDGTKYWLVKNSWESSWGESGYIRMQRGITAAHQGLCGIAMQASYPTA
ncbi:hypothetical protein ACS0TY_032242 [Phlomoides rotata]